MADLVRRQVAVIVAIGATPSPQAAKAVTSTIPIVFAVGSDAVNSGLVTSLNRPEANMTGVTFTNSELGPKRLELMRELLPGVTSIAYLGNPTVGTIFDTNVQSLVAAARTLGRRLFVFKTVTAADIDTALAAIVQQGIAALLELSARSNCRIVGPSVEQVRAGGLMSYGIELHDLYRWAGIYTGRILKGAKPGDLPVMLPTKYELVINNKTAKALGIDVPLSLLIRVDEVIE